MFHNATGTLFTGDILWCVREYYLLPGGATSRTNAAWVVWCSGRGEYSSRYWSCSPSAYETRVWPYAQRGKLIFWGPGNMTMFRVRP